MQRTFSVAFILAKWQAIAATTIAIVSVILVVTRDPGDLIGSYWQSDQLFRLTLVDVALALSLVVAAIDYILLGGEQIRKAVRSLDPRHPEKPLQRLIALSGAASIACGFGLAAPPAPVRKLVGRSDPLSLVSLLWPTTVSTILIFVASILIASLAMRRNLYRDD